MFFTIFNRFFHFTELEDEMQREQIKKMIYMSPLMIVVFSLFSPASVTLYWVVGGFMMILQQFIVNYIVRPKLRKKVREELAKNPPKASAFSTPSGRKDVTPEQPTAITSKKKPKKSQRWKTTFEIKLRRLALCQL